METNEAGRAIIKNAEGLRLKAYRCPAGIWTIGYGHTGKDVRPGMTITADQAEELLDNDLARFEEDVAFLTQGRATSNQFSALVSFAYNVGSDIDSDDICEGLGDSTLLRKFMAGDIQGAADEFPKWCKAGGKKLPGLVARRDAERTLFLTPDV